MPGECLDTNIVIALVECEPQASGRMRLILRGYIPVTVLGELMYGIAMSARQQVNRERLERALEDIIVIPVDAATAQFYAAIRAQLKRAGRPIPDNDIWIAATAIQHELTLITRDSHVEHIEGLAVESWT